MVTVYVCLMMVTTMTMMKREPAFWYQLVGSRANWNCSSHIHYPCLPFWFWSSAGNFLEFNSLTCYLWLCKKERERVVLSQVSASLRIANGFNQVGREKREKEEEKEGWLATNLLLPLFASLYFPPTTATTTNVTD